MLTLSSTVISNLALGGFFFFLAIRSYRSRKNQPRSVGASIAPFVFFGVALFAIGILLSLGVFREGWANAAFNAFIWGAALFVSV